MTWLETPSRTFVARHDERDEPDAAQVLAQLEAARERFAALLPGADPGELAVVLHGTEAQLDAAQPWLVMQRAQTAAAARRYLVGWCTERELHVLSPRVLAHRASNAPGSLELLMLTPVALLAKRFVASANPQLPPPFTPRSFGRYLRWAWLVEGAGQWLSGQTPHARPAILRRLREGSPPEFPPSRRDAPLLGGTVFDLLAREEGRPAAIALAGRPSLPKGAEEMLLEAFHGRPLRHTAAAWRAHLTRFAEGGEEPARERRARERRS